MTFGINFSLELNHFNPQPRKCNQKVNPDKQKNEHTNAAKNKKQYFIKQPSDLESFTKNECWVQTRFPRSAFRAKDLSRDRTYVSLPCYLQLCPAILCGKWHRVPHILSDNVIYFIDRYFKMTNSGLKADQLAVIHRILGGKLSKREIEWLSQQALARNEK